MLKISNKGQSMPSSPIRKLVPFSDSAKKRGVKVYHLNIGQPDIETPKNAIDALKKADLSIVEYSHSAGILSYRKKLVEYYGRYDIKLDENEIIVTNGGSEAILFAFMSCLDEGDEVIIPEPFYANYNGFATSSGVVIKPIYSSIETGFALPPINDFEKMITPKTKAILVCNPNNPTGYLYSKAELEALAKIVKKHNLFLIADEVYREFCYDGQKHYSTLLLEDVSENVIVVDSVSKRYSACGARVGAFITKNKTLYNTVMKFAQARLSPPTFGQIMAEAAVDTPKEYFDSVLSDYVERKNIVVDAINKMDGCFCPNPGGAFYIIARLPIDNSDKFCQWLLEGFNYHGETVMLAPATGFYASENRGINEVRISFCLNVDDMQTSMKILEEALKVYPGRTI